MLTCPDVSTLITWIRRGHRYRHLYHFTDGSNLQGIKRFGLMSRDHAALNRVLLTRLGGDAQSFESMKERGLTNYVSLSFTFENPMMHNAIQDGRLVNPVILEIDPIVLTARGAMLASTFANDRAANIRPIASALDFVDEEVLYTHTNWKDPEIKKRRLASRKVEILIPRIVPAKYVVRERRLP